MYYQKSKIIVTADEKNSRIFEISEGVKQGGVISPYLFNFFINNHLEKNDTLNVGAKLGKINTHTVSYCDDILILSPTESHMKKFFDSCAEFTSTCKVEFNASKSVALSLGASSSTPSFLINNVPISSTENFIYLGHPVGDDEFCFKFYEEKMKKSEKAFYSLRGLGCKLSGLNPRVMPFIYKQLCQSIIRYGLEVINLSNSRLRLLNIRQNNLIKKCLSLSIYSRTKPIVKILKIEQISQIYFKHKIFFLKQIYSNSLTKNIFETLGNCYKKRVPPVGSYFHQINLVN